jgi:hypothetical protein
MAVAAPDFRRRAGLHCFGNAAEQDRLSAAVRPSYFEGPIQVTIRIVSSVAPEQMTLSVGAERGASANGPFAREAVVTIAQRHGGVR